MRRPGGTCCLGGRRPWRPALLVAALAGLPLAVSPAHIGAQEPEVARERAEYARWLATAPVSPLGAVAIAAVGPGIEIGPAGADVQLDGFPLHRVTERAGRLTITGPRGDRPLVRGRPVALGAYTFLAGGAPGRTTIAVHQTPPAAARAPSWYPYDPAAAFVVTLDPPPRHEVVRVLAADGTEVEAAEAGAVRVTIAGKAAMLLVRRMPGATTEESELEVYFRDGTNGRGTYPAGRFVTLIPVEGARYRLDFNRARNPFCAYSSVYPCPAPWRGNSVAAPIEAGERYSGGGLDPGPPRGEGKR